MSVAMHHRLTAAPNMNRILMWSFIGHVLVLIALSFSISHRIRISAPAIQVKLVGVPQPTASSKLVEPEKIRTQDSAAPKEPPPEMKNIPPSDATTKFMTEQKPLDPDKKLNPIEAKERPPTLDKSPREKKVVKNDLDAKVVKNPEDFLESIDDFLKDTKTTPTPKPVPATDKPAGEGPQLQLNMSDAGVNGAIGAAVNKNWTVPTGKDLRGLSIVVQMSLSPDGRDLTSLQVSQSSGDKSFDDSLIRAIRKAVIAGLPIPGDKLSDYTSPFEMSFSQQ